MGDLAEGSSQAAEAQAERGALLQLWGRYLPATNKECRLQTVARLRTEANEERKRTLLVEYRHLRKANAFVDRRIGEEDEDMTEADRAVARFQRQRVREARQARFNLADDSTVSIPHSPVRCAPKTAPPSPSAR